MEFIRIYETIIIFLLMSYLCSSMSSLICTLLIFNLSMQLNVSPLISLSHSFNLFHSPDCICANH
ncbi:hypothetical protein T11_16513 [Trichinella zimbabwensis]|uniref:Uncharacterized protein n=1 Tax=Trichinella zimbabwensis TaxID=268475 RepID=A0A0V1HSF6_9BILA|nr:hypothetical protein T11_16513 [Trichinella zimbabwensis]